MQWEFGAGLTVGRGAELSARQMRHMATRGMAGEHLSEEELEGGHGRQHAVAPGCLTSLAADRQHHAWLEWSCPRCLQARQHGSDTGYHPFTSCMEVGGSVTSYRRCKGRPPSSEILKNSELTPSLQAIRRRAHMVYVGGEFRRLASARRRDIVYCNV